MRLGLTNLAWHPAQDAAVAALLRRLSIDAIDIAPSKYFADVRRVRDHEVVRVRRWWAGQGMEIVGMQSLLYGTQGLNLFGPAPVRQQMLDYLRAVCRVGALLGASCLVFGSPANRNRAGLPDDLVWQMAQDFFGQLGCLAAAEGVQICLEGVHPHYGCNFMTDTASSLRLAMALNQNAVGVVLDTATVQLNGEDIGALLAEGGQWVRHIHASEKDLVPLGSPSRTCPVDHAHMAAAIRAHLPEQRVCVEMLAGAEPAADVAFIDPAMELAQKYYGAG